MGLVLAAGAGGTLVGGVWSDWAVRHYGRNPWPRRVSGFILYGITALFIQASVWCDSATLSAVVTALGCFALHCQQATWWTCASEISGRHLGALFGLMNSMGVVGAMVSQYFFGWFAEQRKTAGFLGRDIYDPAFTVFAVILFAGACGWWFMNTTRAVDDPAP